MRTLALIARHPTLDRDSFRNHYEQHHVPLALPLLEGLTRYVRNHVVASSGGESPFFDVMTEFTYRDSDAFEAVLARLGSPAGVAIAEDELQFMDKARNVFFGVEERGGTGSEDPEGLEKWALLGVRQSDEDRESCLTRMEGLLQEDPALSVAWRHWASRAMGSEPPFDAVAFLWCEPGSLDDERLTHWAARLGRGGVVLQVKEARTPLSA